jgi:hypothetical protein
LKFVLAQDKDQSMKRNRFSEEQIIGILKEHEAGVSVPICAASMASATRAKRLRAHSRRSHRPTGQIQLPGRTQDWIKRGGKVMRTKLLLPE